MEVSQRLNSKGTVATASSCSIQSFLGRPCAFAMTGDGIPQYESGGPEVFLRNTFLEVKDPAPTEPTVARSSSAGILPSELERSSLSDLPTGGAPPPQSQKVDWTVDGRKLLGRERQIVSPPFELEFGPDHPNVPCKMTIYPKISHESKRDLTFRTSHGQGFVQLKCEAELPASFASVTFVISIGSGKNIKEARGPVEHYFGSSAVCGLPKGGDIWDFPEVVDQASQTFVVCLEITPTKDVVLGQ